MIKHEVLTQYVPFEHGNRDNGGELTAIVNREDVATMFKKL